MTYSAAYKKVLRKNFMLVIIAFVLLFPTFFVWAGVPFFIIGGAVAHITTSPILVYLCVALSGGILFSLYFLPINVKVARYMADTKESSALYSFLRLEMIWIVVVAVIWGLGMLVIL